MFLFYVLSFFKKGDTIQGGTLFKGGHYLRKYGTCFLKYWRHLVDSSFEQGTTHKQFLLIFTNLWPPLLLLLSLNIASSYTFFLKVQKPKNLARCYVYLFFNHQLDFITQEIKEYAISEQNISFLGNHLVIILVKTQQPNWPY